VHPECVQRKFIYANLRSFRLYFVPNPTICTCRGMHASIPRGRGQGTRHGPLRLGPFRTGACGWLGARARASRPRWPWRVRYRLACSSCRNNATTDAAGGVSVRGGLIEEVAGSKDRGAPPQEVTSHDRHNEQRRLAGGGTGRFGRWSPDRCSASSSGVIAQQRHPKYQTHSHFG